MMLPNNLILFSSMNDNYGHYGNIEHKFYSIDKGKIVEKIFSNKGFRIRKGFCEDNDVALLVESKLGPKYSSRNDDYVQFLLYPTKNFTTSEIYSTLRNGYIPLEEKTLDNAIKALELEEYYKNYVDEYFKNIDRKGRNESLQKMLSKNNK